MQKYNPDIVETLHKVRGFSEAVQYLKYLGVTSADMARILFGSNTPPRHVNCRSTIKRK